MSHSIEVLETADLLAARAVAIIHAAARRAIEEHGEFLLAVPGGSTPKLTLSFLASRAGFPWERTVLGLTDERLVPPEDERSNLFMLRRVLLDPLTAMGLSPKRVIKWPTEDGPALPAKAEAALTGGLGDRHFDLVVLGLGPDGHVASVFPGAVQSVPGQRVQRSNPTEGLEPAVFRISLTMAEINEASERLILVEGSDKRAIAARVLARAPDALELPGTNLSESETLWLLDRAAAADIKA